jgi:hypothetical protein
LRNEIIEEILATRLNSKLHSHQISQEEIEEQIQKYKNLNVLFEREMIAESEILNGCYSMDRFLY